MLHALPTEEVITTFLSKKGEGRNLPLSCVSIRSCSHSFCGGVELFWKRFSWCDAPEEDFTGNILDSFPTSP